LCDQIKNKCDTRIIHFRVRLLLYWLSNVETGDGTNINKI